MTEGVDRTWILRVGLSEQVPSEWGPEDEQESASGRSEGRIF